MAERRQPEAARGHFAPKRKDDLSETFSIVVSIFGLIGLGYLVAWSGLLSAAVGEKLLDFVFTLAIPLLIFDTLATADLHGVSPWRIWGAYFAVFAIVWVVSDLMVRRVFGRDARAGIVAGGSAAYSNGVLIGVPLMQAALGDGGTVFLIIIIAIHLPLLMLISVVLNEWVLVAADKRGRRGLAPRELRAPSRDARAASDPDRDRCRDSCGA